MRHSGQALHEYAIVLVLVTILCVGALKLLGRDIRNLLDRGDTSRSGSVQDLYALIGTPVNGQSQASVPQSIIPDGATLGINPANGQITLLESGNGGSQNSSSAEGSQVVLALADRLGDLTGYRTEDGEPLPDDVQALLRQLSASGKQMGMFYSAYQGQQDAFSALNNRISQAQLNGQYEGGPYYDGEFVGQAIGYTEQYMTFSETFHQLSGKLENNPAYRDLQKQVADYAGGLSGMAHKNVGLPIFSEFHVSNIRPQDLQTAFASNPNTARQFRMLESATANNTAPVREKIFQQGIVAMGQQMQVGTPITAEKPLSLEAPVLTASR